VSPIWSGTRTAEDLSRRVVKNPFRRRQRWDAGKLQNYRSVLDASSDAIGEQLTLLDHARAAFEKPADLECDARSASRPTRWPAIDRFAARNCGDARTA